MHTPTRPDRPSRRRDVASNRHIATKRECAYGVFAVEDDDKVCDVCADLEAPPETACCDAGGGGPGAVWESGDDEA